MIDGADRRDSDRPAAEISPARWRAAAVGIVAALSGLAPPSAQAEPRVAPRPGDVTRAASVVAEGYSDWRTEPHLDIVPRSASEAGRIAAVTAPTTDFSAPETFEQNPGGGATVRYIAGADAFSQFSANMPLVREMDFKLGNGLFRKLWIGAPSSTRGSDGLGPLYNARSCQNCHIKDGRGHMPDGATDSRVSALLRLSVPGGPDQPQIPNYLPTRPDPVYGDQLQDLALAGFLAEARMAIDWTDLPVTLADGTTIRLRRPDYSLQAAAYGGPDRDLMISPRVAPQMIGLGLLEAVPVMDILALADPEDSDGDGISGRPNIVWSKEFDRPMLGRFGLKAGMPTILHQSAAAFSGDMGLSNPIFPDPSGDCTTAQSDCRDAVGGQEDGVRDGLEVDDESLDLVGFYARNLAVPARRDLGDPQVLRGKQIAHQIGCVSCHNPKFVTHRLRDRPEQSFQLIWPYSDLLLHDMGEGLADNRPESRADGREWRTAPLWGISLNRQVTGVESYLHDGRATSLIEAILWHGGEAQAPRDAVVALPTEDREALIRWLESL